jgi:hypothetical protein
MEFNSFRTEWWEMSIDHLELSLIDHGQIV